MSNNRNVRRVSRPGEASNDDISFETDDITAGTGVVDQSPRLPLPRGVQERMSHRIVTKVGPNALDRPRREARYKTFPNTATERRYLNAIDQAAFDRVRQYEELMIKNAELAIGHAATNAEAADEVTQALNDLADKLDSGEYSQEMVKEFNKLRMRTERTLMPKLDREARTLEEFHLPKLEDPYKAAQDTWAEMPTSTFNPLDPSPYLR